MSITFIGYRGCGKSTVAALLAPRLGWSWADADVEIEHRAGCSIQEIFAELGEPVFREMERQVITELLAGQRLILAAGGGAIMDPQTRTHMRQAGPVVWLQADVEELSRRISTDDWTASRRPSLTGEKVTAEIAQVLKSREPLYRETATIEIETAGRSPQAVADAVFDALPTDVLTDR